FNAPVCVSQNRTGSLKKLPAPAVIVTSVPPSGLRAREVNERSVAPIAACAPAALQVRSSRPVWASQRSAPPEPWPQTSSAASAENVTEAAPPLCPSRVRRTAPVFGLRTLTRPSAAAVATDDPSGAYAIASTSAL